MEFIEQIANRERNKTVELPLYGLCNSSLVPGFESGNLISFFDELMSGEMAGSTGTTGVSGIGGLGSGTEEFSTLVNLLPIDYSLISTNYSVKHVLT